MKTTDLIFGIFSSLNLQQLSFDTLHRLVSPFDVTAGTLRTNLSRMSSSGLVRIERRGKKAIYSLQQKSETIQENVSFHLAPVDWSSWDHRWLGFAFSIPEENRTVRRRVTAKLAAYHLGRLYPGLWIRPLHEQDPAKEAVQDLAHEGLGTAMEITFSCEPEKSRIAEIWEIDRIGLAYESSIDTLRQSHSHLSGLSAMEAFRESFLLGDRIVKQLFQDPQLPQELLPDSWQGGALRTLFSEWYQEIRERRAPYLREVLGSHASQEQSHESN